MSPIRRTFTRAVTYSLMISTVFADVVVLKSGEKVEGKILRQNDQQVTLEVKVSAGIFDERNIPRTDIDHIDVVTPEMEAYKAIMALQPGTNSLGAAQYDPSIRLLQGFLKQYPNGGHTKEVQALVDEFLKEKKRVEAGEVKLHGEWISKVEAEKEKVQINGLLSYEYMKSLSAAGDNIGALNAFVNIEKNYGGASIMPDAVDLARQLIATIKPAVERATLEQKTLNADKMKGIADAAPAERAEMLAAYKADMAQAEANAAASDKAGQWPAFNRLNEKALTILLAHADKEATKLAAIPTDSMRKSVEFTNTAKQKLEARDFDAANAAIKEAGTLWPTNELVKRLTADVVAQKAAAAAAAKPSATPAPMPDTPKPKTTPAKSTPIKSASAATPAPEESSFFMSIPGAITVVVGIAAVLIGVNVFKKMKAKKGSDVELQ